MKMKGGAKCSRCVVPQQNRSLYDCYTAREWGGTVGIPRRRDVEEVEG